MKKVGIKTLNIQQMVSEIDTLLRVTDFLGSENINLKNRLSQVIQNDLAVGMLEQIETYQNSFITFDTILALLVRDIKEHKKRILIDSATESDLSDKTIHIQNKLRDDVGKTEKEFAGLRANFNKFLMNIFD